MLVYLDLCCFNRPFDDQRHDRIRLETEAKLYLQQRVIDGRLDLAWSYMLSFENSANPDPDVRDTIAGWEARASILVQPAASISQQANLYQGFGVQAMDALHVACAAHADAAYFLTVDNGILKRSGSIEELKVMNPAAFLLQEA